MGILGRGPLQFEPVQATCTASQTISPKLTFRGEAPIFPPYDDQKQMHCGKGIHTKERQYLKPVNQNRKSLHYSP